MYSIRRLSLMSLLAVLPACATLGALGGALSAPVFNVDRGQRAELRLLPPGPGRPAGGAAVRLYARVSNPNAIGLTLRAVQGGLLLEGKQAAQVDFPLGIPLAAGGETVIPMDIGISFSDLPGLADVASRAITGRPVAYRLNGTVGVDAGVLGTPTFGPMTLLEGDLEVRR